MRSASACMSVYLRLRVSAFACQYIRAYFHVFGTLNSSTITVRVKQFATYHHPYYIFTSNTTF